MNSVAGVGEADEWSFSLTTLLIRDYMMAAVVKI